MTQRSSRLETSSSIVLQDISAGSGVNRNPSRQSDPNADGNSDVTTGEIEYPEGGLQAWLVVAGSFLGLITAFGVINSTGAIEAYIAINQLSNVSTTTIGWIFSIFNFCCFLFTILSGDLFDRYGARGPLIIGTCLVAAGLIACGSCTSVWQFLLAFSFVAGSGIAIITSPLVGVVSHYFNRKRGFAMSIATMGGSVGGAVFPISLQKMYTSIGFGWAMRVFGFICLATLIGAIILAKGRVFGNQHRNLSSSFKDKFSLPDVRRLLDLKALKDRQFFYCVFGVVFTECTSVASATYYASYAISRGVKEQEAYLMLTVLNVVGIPSRWLTGYLSDRVGVFNVVMTLLFFAILSCLIIWLPFGQIESALWAHTVIFGFCTASLYSLVPVCIARISRVEIIGVRYSTAYFFVALGSLFFTPVGGAIINNGSLDSYRYFIIYIAVCYFIGLLFMLASRYQAVKFRLAAF